MNSFMHILPVLVLLVLNSFSSKHSFIACFGIVENHSNNSEKCNFISDVLTLIWVCVGGGEGGNFTPPPPVFPLLVFPS